MQSSLYESWVIAITRRLREPTAKEIVLIALAFLEIFLPISKTLDEIKYDNYPSIKKYPMIPVRNNFL